MVVTAPTDDPAAERGVPQRLRSADGAGAPPLPLSIVPPPAAIVSVRRLAAASALIVPLIPTFPSLVALSVVIVTLLLSVTAPVIVTLFPAVSPVTMSPLSVAVVAVRATEAISSPLRWPPR